MADALSTILETTQAERLATGFGFTEGPLWDPTNGCYYFVDLRRNRLHRLTPGKEPEVVRENTGEGNGTDIVGGAQFRQRVPQLGERPLVQRVVHVRAVDGDHGKAVVHVDRERLALEGLQHVLLGHDPVVAEVACAEGKRGERFSRSAVQPSTTSGPRKVSIS